MRFAHYNSRDRDPVIINYFLNETRRRKKIRKEERKGKRSQSGIFKFDRKIIS